MKIGIIQAVIGAGGGNDIYLRGLLRALKKTEHDINLYSVSKPLIDMTKYDVKSIRSVLPFKLPIFSLYQKLFESMITKHSGKDDLVIILTGELFLPATENQRIIYISQNNFGRVAVPVKYKHGIWKIYYMPFRYFAKRLRERVKNLPIEFIAISKHTQKQMQNDLGYRSQVIYPPCDLQEFKCDKPRRHGIIVVGRISPEKNLEFAIKVLAMWGDKAKIFGSVTKATRPYFKHIAKPANKYNIKMIVNQPRNQLITHVQKSKVYFHAGEETFGFTIVEAITAGCIPIVPDMSAHRETVPFDELRYRPNSIEDARLKIERAMQGKFDFLKPRLKQHVQKFSQEAFEERLKMIINREITVNN